MNFINNMSNSQFIAGLSEDDTLMSVEDLTNNLEQSGKIKFDKGSIGVGGTYQKLPVGILYSERKYQRFISKSTVQKARRVNLGLLQPLVIYKRPNGIHVIVDGQHKAIMAVLGEGLEFEVPCIVYEHPVDRDHMRCVEVEAQMFEDLNMSRKNVSGLDKYRAGIAYGDEDSIKFEESLIGVGVYAENLGDTEYGIEVRGWVKLRSAYTKYNLRYTKNAVDFLKPIYTKEWDKSYVDGSLVFALTAINFLMDKHLGARKAKGLKEFMRNYFHKTTANKWTANSAGNTDYIIIARRIVDKYNTLVESEVIDGAVIGSKTLDDAGLSAIDKLK